MVEQKAAGEGWALKLSVVRNNLEMIVIIIFVCVSGEISGVRGRRKSEMPLSRFLMASPRCCIKTVLHGVNDRCYRC